MTVQTVEVTQFLNYFTAQFTSPGPGLLRIHTDATGLSGDSLPIAVQ